MKKISLENVEDLSTGSFKQLPAGGYVCAIKKVVDHEDEEYLEVQYDIVRGEYKGYWTNFEKEKGWANNTFRVYYREGMALRYFKSFITAIEESNKNFKFDGVHEKTLEKKYIGLIIGIREYQGNDGRIKTREDVRFYRSMKTIESGDFMIPELQKLDNSVRASKPKEAKKQEEEGNFEDIFSGSGNDNNNTDTEDDDDLPF